MADDVRTLKKPDWQFPQLGRDFVRHHGLVRRRRRGGHDFWPDEVYYAEADSALKLPGLLDRRLCVFRRLYCAGPVVRMQVGIKYKNPQYILHLISRSTGRSSRSVGRTPLYSDDLLYIVSDCLNLPTHIPDRDGHYREARLVDSSEALADLFERSTCPTNLPRAPDPTAGLVSATEIAVIVELGYREVWHLPEHSVPIDVGEIGGTSLAYYPTNFANRDIGAWFLSPSRIAIDALASANRAAIRRLRIGLLRLHAEQEVLKAVLRLWARNEIIYHPRTVPGNLFATYLFNSSKLLGKAKHANFSPRAVRDVMAAFETVTPEEREILRRKIKEIQRQWQAPIGDFLDSGSEAAKRSRTSFIFTNSEIVFNTEGGPIVDAKETHGIEISGGTITNAVIAQKARDITQTIGERVSDPEKKKSLTDLNELIQKLVPRLDEPVAKDVVEDLETFTKEATRETPRKSLLEVTGKGLVDAAKAVADMAEPVLSVVTRILALFP